MPQIVRTTNDLIVNALYLLGELGVGETPDAFMLSTGLDLINELLDKFSADSIYIPYLTTIDHQFIVDKSDPLINQLVGLDLNLIEVFVPGTNFSAGWKVDLTHMEVNTPEYEYYEGFFIVDFVPTSEKLSSWMADIVDAKMAPLNVLVNSIEWWETPKSRSIYYR